MKRKTVRPKNDVGVIRAEARRVAFEQAARAIGAPMAIYEDDHYEYALEQWARGRRIDAALERNALRRQVYTNALHAVKNQLLAWPWPVRWLVRRWYRQLARWITRELCDLAAEERTAGKGRAT